MQVLYVEDDISKVKQVTKFIADNIPDCKVTIKNSYTSGVLEIQREKYDLILLDMSLPLYDVKDCDPDESNDFETFAGIDILEEMKRINNSSDVIILTAFDVLGENENKVNLDQLNERMLKEYATSYRGVIHYNTSSLEWSNILRAFIKEKYNI